MVSDCPDKWMYRHCLNVLARLFHPHARGRGGGEPSDTQNEIKLLENGAVSWLSQVVGTWVVVYVQDKAASRGMFLI